jgi:IPTL-CTERM motif
MSVNLSTFRPHILRSLIGVSTISAASALALGPFPSVQITGIDTSQPRGSCDAPSIELFVEANGTGSQSDNFFVLADGALIYSWTGESMTWVNTAGPNTYSVSTGGAAANLPANTRVTARIETYDSVNPAGPIFVAGNAVYRSEISWNCTTGAQLGSVNNFDLRVNSIVPTLQPAALAFAALLLGFMGWRRLRKFCATNRNGLP